MVGIKGGTALIPCYCCTAGAFGCVYCTQCACAASGCHCISGHIVPRVLVVPVLFPVHQNFGKAADGTRIACFIKAGVPPRQVQGPLLSPVSPPSPPAPILFSSQLGIQLLPNFLIPFCLALLLSRTMLFLKRKPPES